MAKTPPPSGALQRAPGASVGSALVPAAGAAPLPQRLQEGIQAHFRGAFADRTAEGYAADWELWKTWCRQMGQPDLPTTELALAAYLTDLDTQGKAYNTIARRLVAIRRAHTLAKHPRPGDSIEVQLVMQSIARKKRKRVKRKAPILREDLRRMLAHAPAGLVGLRDKALLMVAFSCALRSASLVALDVGDFEWRAEGVLVTLRKSKTDQEGEGRRKPLRWESDANFCAARALKAWLEAANLTSGPAFRSFTKAHTIRPRRLSARVVGDLLKDYGERAGLEIDPRNLGSHSLRAGHVTQRYDDGDPEADIQKTTDHTSVTMLRRYDRREQRDPFAGASSVLSGGKKGKKT